MTNVVGFTAFDVEQKPTSVFTSGEYQYAVAGPDGNTYNKARFGIEVAKDTGLILLAYITVDNTDIIAYRQGEYMQIS